MVKFSQQIGARNRLDRTKRKILKKEYEDARQAEIARLRTKAEEAQASIGTVTSVEDYEQKYALLDPEIQPFFSSPAQVKADYEKTIPVNQLISTLKDNPNYDTITDSSGNIIGYKQKPTTYTTWYDSNTAGQNRTYGTYVAHELRKTPSGWIEIRRGDYKVNRWRTGYDKRIYTSYQMEYNPEGWKTKLQRWDQDDNQINLSKYETYDPDTQQKTESIRWNYDSEGRTTSKTSTKGGVTKYVSYKLQSVTSTGNLDDPFTLSRRNLTPDAIKQANKDYMDIRQRQQLKQIAKETGVSYEALKSKVDRGRTPKIAVDELYYQTKTPEALPAVDAVIADPSWQNILKRTGFKEDVKGKYTQYKQPEAEDMPIYTTYSEREAIRRLDPTYKKIADTTAQVLGTESYAYSLVLGEGKKTASEKKAQVTTDVQTLGIYPAVKKEAISRYDRLNLMGQRGFEWMGEGIRKGVETNVYAVERLKGETPDLARLEAIRTANKVTFENFKTVLRGGYEQGTTFEQTYYFPERDKFGLSPEAYREVTLQRTPAITETIIGATEGIYKKPAKIATIFGLSYAISPIFEAGKYGLVSQAYKVSPITERAIATSIKAGLGYATYKLYVQPKYEKFKEYEAEEAGKGYREVLGESITTELVPFYAGTQAFNPAKRYFSRKIVKAEILKNPQRWEAYATGQRTYLQYKLFPKYAPKITAEQSKLLLEVAKLEVQGLDLFYKHKIDLPVKRDIPFEEAYKGKDLAKARALSLRKDIETFGGSSVSTRFDKGQFRAMKDWDFFYKRAIEKLQKTDPHPFMEKYRDPFSTFKKVKTPSGQRITAIYEEYPRGAEGAFTIRQTTQPDAPIGEKAVMALKNIIKSLNPKPEDLYRFGKDTEKLIYIGAKTSQTYPDAKFTKNVTSITQQLAQKAPKLPAYWQTAKLGSVPSAVSKIGLTSIASLGKTQEVKSVILSRSLKNVLSASYPSRSIYSGSPSISSISPSISSISPSSPSVSSPSGYSLTSSPLSPSTPSTPSTPSYPSPSISYGYSISVPSVSVPSTPPAVILPALFGAGKGSRKKKHKKKESFALLPDFTSRALGLQPSKVSANQAIKELKKLQSGFNIRTGARIA